MSGPKSSRYTLTAAQRRAIQRQLEAELRRAQLALEEEKRRKKEEKRVNEYNNFQKNCTVAKSALDSLHLIIADTKEKISSDERDPAGLLAIHDFCKAMEKKIQSLEDVDPGSDYEVFHSRNLDISKAILSIQDAQLKAGAIQKKQTELYKIKMLERLNMDFNISFKGIANRKQVEQSDYIPRILEALEEIANLELSEDLRQKLEIVKGKAREIESANYLENYYSITVIPFVKECKKYDELITNYGQEYEDLYNRYRVLCNLVGEPIKEIPFSENANGLLLDSIAEIEKRLLEKREEEYIADCIDQAMVELGYTTVGSRETTIRNGRHFRNELYKVAEGTVVNVTYADDGQVTMEVGAVDTEDRVPTDQEKHSLVEDMTEFCGDYAKVEQKLKEKGIEPKRVSVLPPYPEYAQIIDISEYDMVGDVGTYHSRKRVTNTTTSLHKGE